jgi:transcriptional regulator with XRE-family HTH domain
MAERAHFELDVRALAAAVATIARHRNLSMRAVAAETGLSASTLTRLSQGQKPDADGLVTLLSWLGIEIEFARRRYEPPWAEPPAETERKTAGALLDASGKEANGDA